MLTEKQANALILGPLCHIQLFGRQGFNDKGARWISLSKTKKTSLSSFLPGLQGERCGKAVICCVVEGESFFKCTGFSFHDFADSHVVIPMGLVTPSPTHRRQDFDFFDRQNSKDGNSTRNLCTSPYDFTRVF